MEHPAVIGGK